jgi:CBS domain-containing protein
MATGIKVKEAMITPVVTGKPEETVLDAAKRMEGQDVGSLIIVVDSKPVGIVTREDIVNKVVAKNLLPSEVLIKEIQSSNLITCPPDCDISEAANLMSKYKYERIPVVSLGNLIGIISAREIAKVAPAMLEIATEHLRIEEPPPSLEEIADGECEICGNYSDKLHYVNDRWVCDNCREEEEV